MTDVLHQTSRTVLAQSALLDSLALLVQRQATQIAALEERVELLNKTLWAANDAMVDQNEEIAELRDFVHGLNDRHTTLQIALHYKFGGAFSDGALAPRVKGSD